jgi:integrase
MSFGTPSVRTWQCEAAQPKAIQELAGHSTLQMTMRYMHLAPMVLLQAIELLNLGQQVGNAEAAKL